MKLEFEVKIDIFFIRNAKIVAAVWLKKYITSAGIFYIIIDKFSY